MMERQHIEPICQEMRTYGYEPVIRLHPLYGTLDVVLLRDPRNNAERDIVENLVERVPFRALIDCDVKRRARLQRDYEVKGYAVSDLNDNLKRSVERVIAEHEDDFASLSGAERVFCAKARVAAIEVQPHHEGVVLGIVDEHLLVPRIYEAICPSAIVAKMVYTPGLVVLNCYPQQRNEQTFQRARHAEDLPELQREADEIEKRRRGTA